MLKFKFYSAHACRWISSAGSWNLISCTNVHLLYAYLTQTNTHTYTRKTKINRSGHKCTYHLVVHVQLVPLQPSTRESIMRMQPQGIDKGEGNAEDPSENGKEGVLWRLLTLSQKLLHRPKTNQSPWRNTQLLRTSQDFLKALFSLFHNSLCRSRPFNPMMWLRFQVYGSLVLSGNWQATHEETRRDCG